MQLSHRPRRTTRHTALAALAACTLATALPAAHAAGGWDEAVQGDLANAGTTPTAITLELGSNPVRGTTGRVNSVVDRDYFSFTLAEGLQLDTLTVVGGSFLGISGLSFIAVQAGPQVTVNPTGGSATGLLGWVHFGENDIGTDILGLMGIGFGASGFSSPLPAGTYSFWLQDTGTGVASYQLDFGVSAVPEPTAAWLILGGLAGLAGVVGAKRNRPATR
ncbi:hypothetical protein IP87_18070 [beta proteobacterium AAP121]|nr:hypothetical protein IP80_10625 [beta proteobacterium AAP65]KPF94845.1 hypothetical protein IP87_18070 [beta proteobacterium AAP121]